MKPVYIVTGAAGHLGSVILRLLARSPEAIELRGLIMRGETAPDIKGVSFFEGDVRDAASLERLFEATAGKKVCLIHAAGIVDISGALISGMWEVNVGGTLNIIDACRTHGVDRLVYVSSVHALPEGRGIQREVRRFDPQRSIGAYAMTKAEASQAVLDAADAGLDAVIVHPSGILGPMGGGGNHLVQVLHDYMCGRLPACVKGGYDLVDVRDVAMGCIEAAKAGRRGECYILSNRRVEISELLAMARDIVGGKKLAALPIWMAKAALPFMKLYAKLRGQRPLFTGYALYALASNSNFSHEKASRELGYSARSIRDTVRDTVEWLRRDTNATVDWARWLT